MPDKSKKRKRLEMEDEDVVACSEDFSGRDGRDEGAEMLYNAMAKAVRMHKDGVRRRQGGKEKILPSGHHFEHVTIMGNTFVYGMLLWNVLLGKEV